MASKITVMMFFNLARDSLPEVLADLRWLECIIKENPSIGDLEMVSGEGTLGTIVTGAVMLVDELVREAKLAATSIPIRTPIQTE